MKIISNLWNSIIKLSRNMYNKFINDLKEHTYEKYIQNLKLKSKNIKEYLSHTPKRRYRIWDLRYNNILENISDGREINMLKINDENKGFDNWVMINKNTYKEIQELLDMIIDK